MQSQQINEVITKVVGVERDYYGCLNAMHEAEKMLTKSQWNKYTDRILDQSTDDEYITEYQVCAHATAAQRAEAFLRTVGKWID